MHFEGGLIKIFSFLLSENQTEAYVPGSFTSKAKAKFFASSSIPDASFEDKFSAVSGKYVTCYNSI